MRHCTMRYRGWMGFTLIELLVVVSIIGVLMGILLPVMAKARQVAMRSACASNLSQIGKVIQSYRFENKQAYPNALYMPAPFLTLFNDVPGLPAVLVNEVEVKSPVYECPGDRNYVYSKTGISYVYNAFLAGRDLDTRWFGMRIGLTLGDIPVAYDCDGNGFIMQDGSTLVVPPFHEKRNLLFADAHVGDFE